MECAVVRAKLWANGQLRGTFALSSRRSAGSPLIGEYHPSGFGGAHIGRRTIQYQNQNTGGGGLRRANGPDTT